MERIKIMKKVLGCPQWGPHKRILMCLVIRVREETIPRKYREVLVTSKDRVVRSTMMWGKIKGSFYLHLPSSFLICSGLFVDRMIMIVFLSVVCVKIY
jgi:hypothetical protein